MYEVELNGNIYTFPHDPTSENLHELVARFGQKPKTSLWEDVQDVGRGVATGTTKAIDTVAKGVTQLAAGAVEPLSQETADDWRQRAQKFYEEQGARRKQEFGEVHTGAGEVSEGVSQGLAVIAGSVINPVAMAATVGGYAMGASTDVMDNLNKKGVDPASSTRAAQIQAAGNAVLGLIPGFGPVKGALMNWATGQLSDMATYEYLVQNGHQEAADVVIGKRGLIDKQGLIDVLVGGVGGKLGTQQAKSDNSKPTDTGAKSKEILEQRRQQADETPPEQTGHESPEQIAYYKQLAEQRAQEMRDTPIPMGMDGFRVEDSQAIQRTEDAKQTAGILSLVDDVPAHKPAPEVEAIDFPLRQEVLDKPHMKAAIARFQKRAAEAQSAEAKQKVENDFAKFMRKYGVDEAADAHGLRRMLYEPQLRNPMGIRKSGELNLSKTDMEGPGIDYNSRLRDPRQGHHTDPLLNEVTWLRQGADDTINLRRSLDEIANDPLNRRFGRSYGTILEKIAKYFEDNGINIRLQDQLRGNEAGVYRAYEGDVLISRRHNTNHTLLHELIHGMTARWLLMNPNHPLAKQLEKIRLDLIKKYGEEAYGLTNTRELLAEFNTNPKFRDMVGKPGLLRSLWNKLLTVMGFNPTESRLISRLNKMTDEIAAGNKKITDSEFRKWADTESHLKEEGVRDKIAKDFTSAMRGKPKPINADDLTDGAGKLRDASKSVVNKPTNSTHPLAKKDQQAEAYARGPLAGMKSWIPEDVSVESVLKAIKELPDISRQWWAIGGKEMVAQMKRNPAVYAIGSWFSKSRARAELYDREYVRPLEHELNKLFNLKTKEGKTQAADLMDILKNEMFMRQRHTDNELAQLLNPKQADVYKTMRTEFDRALDSLNEARLTLGMSPIKPHEAYVASSWGGNWRTPVYALARDAEGNIKIGADGKPEVKLVWWIAEHSKAKAKHALEYLKANEPDIVADRAEVDYDNRFFITEGAGAMAGYKEMVDILGKNDPLVDRLKSIYEGKVQEEGSKALGHHKHFEPKAGIRGFLGDRPWVNNASDVKDFFGAQMSYLRNSHLYTEQLLATDKVKKILTDTDLQQSHPNLLAWTKDMVETERGFATEKAIKHVENSLSKWFGESMDIFPKLTGWMPTDVSSVNTGLGVAKSFFYTTKLGIFNVPFAVMSIVQPVFTMPHHVRLTAEGYKSNPIVTLFDSIRGAATTAMMDVVGDFSGANLKKVRESLPEHLQDAYRYMEDNGMIALNQYSEVGGRSPNETKVMAALNWTITAPERIARTTAFMGYVSHLHQSGKFSDRMELFQKAEQLTNMSMANYKHTERAHAFNELGTSGNALATLQTFKINQLNQLWDFGKDIGLNPTSPKAYAPLMTMMAIQLTMAGAMGFYGLQNVEWIWDNLKRGYIGMGGTDPKIIEFSPKLFMLQHMGPVSAMGMFSQVMADTNYSSRLDAGTILDPSFGGMLPFAGDIGKQIGDMGNAFVDRTAEGRDRALYSVMPSSLKGFAEMNLPTMTDKQGNAFSPDNPKEMLYRRTESDKTKRSIPFHGVPSVKESATKDVEYRSKNAQKLIEKARTNLSEKFEQAIRLEDTKKVDEIIQKYAKLGGDPEQLFKQLPQDVLKRALTMREQMLFQIAKGSLTIQQADKFNRYNEATKNVQGW